MKLLEMKSNIETMIKMKILERILDWTLTSHDNNFIKHLANMQSIGHNNISEYRGLILI